MPTCEKSTLLIQEHMCICTHSDHAQAHILQDRGQSPVHSSDSEQPNLAMGLGSGVGRGVGVGDLNIKLWELVTDLNLTA